MAYSFSDEAGDGAPTMVNFIAIYFVYLNNYQNKASW